MKSHHSKCKLKQKHKIFAFFLIKRQPHRAKMDERRKTNVNSSTEKKITWTIQLTSIQRDLFKLFFFLQSIQCWLSVEKKHSMILNWNIEKNVELCMHGCKLQKKKRLNLYVEFVQMERAKQWNYVYNCGNVETPYASTFFWVVW